MVKRRFTGEELNMANKMMVGRQDELEWNEYQVDYYEMMLDKGLAVNYKKTIRDYRAKLNEFKQELDMVKGIISRLKDQIRNGVDVIDEPKSDGDSEKVYGEVQAVSEGEELKPIFVDSENVKDLQDKEKEVD